MSSTYLIISLSCLYVAAIYISTTSAAPSEEQCAATCSKETDEFVVQSNRKVFAFALKLEEDGSVKIRKGKKGKGGDGATNDRSTDTRRKRDAEDEDGKGAGKGAGKGGKGGKGGEDKPKRGKVCNPGRGKFISLVKRLKLSKITIIKPNNIQMLKADGNSAATLTAKGAFTGACGTTNTQLKNTNNTLVDATVYEVCGPFATGNSSLTADFCVRIYVLNEDTTVSLNGQDVDLEAGTIKWSAKFSNFQCDSSSMVACDELKKVRMNMVIDIGNKDKTKCSGNCSGKRKQAGGSGLNFGDTPKCIVDGAAKDMALEGEGNLYNMDCPIGSVIALDPVVVSNIEPLTEAEAEQELAEGLYDDSSDGHATKMSLPLTTLSTLFTFTIVKQLFL